MWVLELGKIRALMAVISAGLLFAALYMFAVRAITDRYARVKEEMSCRLYRAMKKSKYNLFSYEYYQERLDAWGVTYYTKGRLTPLGYISGKLLGAVMGFTAGLMFHPVIGVCLAAAVYYLPDRLADSRNRRDNEAMLGSIKAVYDVIYLQTSAGEYITAALVDAYRAVIHPRLKAALIELTGDIIASNELAVSMEVFGRKFNNESIYNLVVIVKQLVESGISDAMLRDIKKQLVVLEESCNRHEQERTERLGNACVFACFFCLMGVLVLVSVEWLLSSADMLIR